MWIVAFSPKLLERSLSLLFLWISINFHLDFTLHHREVWNETGNYKLSLSWASLPTRLLYVLSRSMPCEMLFIFIFWWFFDVLIYLFTSVLAKILINSLYMMIVYFQSLLFSFAGSRSFRKANTLTIIQITYQSNKTYPPFPKSDKHQLYAGARIYLPIPTCEHTKNSPYYHNYKWYQNKMWI